MTKKIITISALSLVGLLIIATIIMSFVTVGSHPAIETPNRISMWRNVDGSSQKIERSDGHADLKKIMEKLNSASDNRAIVALFNGTIGSRVDVVKLDGVRTETSIVSNSVAQNKMQFLLAYDSIQTYREGSTRVRYKKIAFIVDSTSDVQEIEMFLIDGEQRSYYKLTYSGVFNDLYEFVMDLSSQNI